MLSSPVKMVNFEISPIGWWEVIHGLDNGLAPNRRQAVIWICGASLGEMS